MSNLIKYIRTLSLLVAVSFCVEIKSAFRMNNNKNNKHNNETASKKKMRRYYISFRHQIFNVKKINR